jgi:D-alanyl-D-alanine carboxypeptidase/D-alanyl-D-alanine-endopeptidase (penicillin-binding protein 4)
MKSKILASCLLSLLSMISFGNSITNGIDALIQKTDSQIHMGIEVVDLTDGSILYQRAPSTPFIPASNMKLMSNAAAYLALGPDYHFTTKLSTHGAVLQAGALKGNVYITLDGDPSLTHEDLGALIQTLRFWGVKRILGQIVVVSNHNGISPYAPGIMQTDKRHAYGAPIAPVMLDNNRINITINPGSRVGELAVVEPSFLMKSLQLDNQVKTVSTPKKCGVGVSFASNNHLIARGCVGVGQWSLIQRLPIVNPWPYFQGVTLELLRQNGIQLDGQIVLGTLPAKTLLIAKHESKPIQAIMADTLKPSDNLYADSLFLHTAYRLSGREENWLQSEATVKSFLSKEMNMPLTDAKMVDGSGLSRLDKLTVHQTVTLLTFLHNRFPIAFEYMSALPIAGTDGTLLKRFKRPFEKGMIRAKTGTMTGIMGLSGYLYTQNGHTLAFAIFINRDSKTPASVAGRYRPLMDNIISYLVQQSPDGVATTPVAIQRMATFEQKPNLAMREKIQMAKWRRIEWAVKKGLLGQSVQVLLRNKQLVIKDKGADINQVWSVLKRVNRSYPFAVILKSNRAPMLNSKDPTLLWIRQLSLLSPNTRVWTISEVVN